MTADYKTTTISYAIDEKRWQRRIEFCRLPWYKRIFRRIPE